MNGRWTSWACTSMLHGSMPPYFMGLCTHVSWAYASILHGRFYSDRNHEVLDEVSTRSVAMNDAADASHAVRYAVKSNFLHPPKGTTKSIFEFNNFRLEVAPDTNQGIRKCYN